jgi:hypothetical protein
MRRYDYVTTSGVGSRIYFYCVTNFAAARLVASISWQHGHRDRRWAGATVRRRRMVAIEFGTWRSGRSGGAAGSVTGGNAKFFEPPGGTRS